jgi:beta-N-acetylhexosaminidase
VGKHAPGHGRAMVDSHLALPVLDRPAPEDLAPFQALRWLPWMMTAHILFTELDDRPATVSPRIIREVIRGEIGFEGLLVTDDLNMKALEGDVTSRALASLDAGVDVALVCSGDLAENRALLAAVPKLSDTARGRLFAARKQVAEL